MISTLQLWEGFFGSPGTQRRKSPVFSFSTLDSRSFCSASSKAGCVGKILFWKSLITVHPPSGITLFDLLRFSCKFDPRQERGFSLTELFLYTILLYSIWMLRRRSISWPMRLNTMPPVSVPAALELRAWATPP